MVNIEISTITDEFSKDFRKVCEYLQENNVKYVELRNVWEKSVIDLDENEISESLEILKDCGLKVSSIASPLLKCTPPSENPNPKEEKNVGKNWKYNYSIFNHTLDLANKFDCRYIRCFGFSGRWAVPELSKWNSWQIYKDWSNIVHKFSEQASSEGKMLICENEGGLNRSLEEIEFLGENHCNSGFGMLYDSANVANKYGLNGILTDEWLSRIGKYVQYIHAKGCKKSWNKYHASYVNGRGDICRWPAIVKFFREMNKDNFAITSPDPLFMSIETHMGPQMRWKKSAKSLKNLIDLVE